MSTASSANRPPVAKRTSRPFRSNRRLWIITGLVLFAVPVFYTILFTAYWPFKKQALIDVLQERSRRSVTIDHFRTTYFPPGGIAEGIKFWGYKHKNKAPLITIQKITLSVTLPTLLTFQHRLDTLHVIGLHLTVPAHEPVGDPSPMLLLTSSTSKSLPIQHLDAIHAAFDFFTGSNSQPLQITVNKLRAQRVSSTTAIAYSAQLSNSEVPGIIDSEGTFGPLDLKQWAGTPVRGHFSYQNGTLAPIHVVVGTLFANGNYSGQIGNIAVSGTAEVQNFTVIGSSHSRKVTADYQLTVNAINGDIGLKKVSAAFDESAILFSGAISAARAHNAKLASIDFSSQRARVQDLLDLFISAKQPNMTGDISLTGHFGLPAMYQSFIRDMTLTGSFGIAQGKFTDESTEAGLTKLSQTSRAGKREESQEDSATVLSHLTGQAIVTQGVAHLSHVEFRIPGARARLFGTYSLLNYQTNLTGTLITTGNVSDTQTGIKSLFLKVLTPFFKHHRNAKIIPFKVTGPYGHTSVSLDMVGKSRKISS